MYISTYCTQHIPSSMPKTYVLQGVVIHWVLCPSIGVKVGKCCTGCPHFFLVFFSIWSYSGLPMDGLPCYVEHLVLWQLDGFVFNCQCIHIYIYILLLMISVVLAFSDAHKQWNLLYWHQVAVSPTRYSMSSCNIHVCWPMREDIAALFDIRHTSDFWGQIWH